MKTEQISLLEDLRKRLAWSAEFKASTIIDKADVAAYLDVVNAVLDHPSGAHDLYTDQDKDRPDAICDRNGQVALSLCKKCGRAEAELDEPCIPKSDRPSYTEQIEAAMWCMFEYGKRDYRGAGKETVDEVRALLASDRSSEDKS